MQHVNFGTSVMRGAGADGRVVVARSLSACPQLGALSHDAQHALTAYYRAREDEVSGRVKTSMAVVTAVRAAVRPKAAVCLHCGGEHMCGPVPCLKPALQHSQRCQTAPGTA